MSRNTLVRISFSVTYPLISFSRYWITFDDNTAVDMLWGGMVTLFLALAIYLYFPVGSRIERGSLIWFFGMFTAVILFTSGLLLSDAEFMSDVYRAWGNYIWFFALWMPVIIEAAMRQNRPSEITLFKGPARWNKNRAEA